MVFGVLCVMFGGFGGVCVIVFAGGVFGFGVVLVVFFGFLGFVLGCGLGFCVV